MDATRFDAWTRRTFGLATASALAAALGLTGDNTAEARRRKKRKCRNLTESCGGKKKCCKSYHCATVGISVKTFCCRSTQQVCTGIDGECCGDRVCGRVAGLQQFRCCAVAPNACSSNNDCCENYRCNGGKCIEVL
jgi:hypothetical protein